MTGAGGGIGRATVERLAAEDVTVVVGNLRGYEPVAEAVRDGGGRSLGLPGGGWNSPGPGHDSGRVQLGEHRPVARRAAPRPRWSSSHDRRAAAKHAVQTDLHAGRPTCSRALFG